MVQRDDELREDLPGKFRTKIKKREKRRKPKMRISGKRVFQLKKIINK
jgi:hypothetical protein